MVSKSGEDDVWSVALLSIIRLRAKEYCQLYSLLVGAASKVVFVIIDLVPVSALNCIGLHTLR